MTDILDEANQDYSFQKRVNLFKKTLPLVALITFILVIVIAIKDWYADKNLSEKEERTSLLIDAISNEEEELKQEALLSLIKQKDGVSDLAAQNIISSLVRSADAQKILEKLTDLIESSKSLVIRNLAKIEYVGILLDKKTLSDEESRKIQTLLVSIDQTQAIYSKAQIYLALYNIKIGNFPAAKDIAKRLVNGKNLTAFLALEVDAILSYINEREAK